MATKISKIIEQINLGKKTNTADYMKHNCRECHNPLTWEEQDLCSKCMIPVLKARQEQRLKEIKGKIEELLEKRGVPKRYLNCTLDNFQAVGEGRKRALRIATDYTKKIATTDEGLFLTGSNGAGKTHLMVAIMREFVLSGYLNCQFVKIPELLLSIRGHIKEDKSEKEEIEKWRGYGCLFLDELGVEKVSEWVLQDLYLILDGRSGDLLPTVITSNLGLEEIEEHLGPRFVSRIVEMCKSVLMEFEDWRKLSRMKKVGREATK